MNVHPEDPKLAEAALKLARDEYQQEQRGVAGNPGFVDLERRDFRLQPDAPALSQGFQPLTHWGVRPEW